MAAEVENPPAAAEEKQQEEAPAVPAESVEPAKEEVKAEEVAAPVVKEAAPKKPAVFKQNFEKDVVYLYQFARTTSLPSLSPYVLKVETWLRLVGLKYEVSREKRFSCVRRESNQQMSSCDACCCLCSDSSHTQTLCVFQISHSSSFFPFNISKLVCSNPFFSLTISRFSADSNKQKRKVDPICHQSANNFPIHRKTSLFSFFFIICSKYLKNSNRRRTMKDQVRELTSSVKR